MSVQKVLEDLLQPSNIFELRVVARSQCCNYIFMFKAFGVVIILWYLSTLFAQSFSSADKAISASFNTLEVAAVISQEQLKQQ